MGIQRLPSTVVSSLRTDVTVATTAQCVTELVLNSVDAGATAIAVRMDLKNLRITVVDNGCGISKSDLKVIGTRYMTSKCNSLHDLQTNLSHFGFRGEALTSIAEVCGTLTIVSRYHDSEETFCKVFTKGVAHLVGKSRKQMSSCGTTITVSDFLYNRPVRRARVKPALDLEETKTHLESIALINPHVSFSLRNDANNELILQTHRSEDIPTVFGTLFGESISKHLVPVKECEGPFKVEGYISTEAHLLKNLQFIFVNKRLLLKTKLHKLMNSLMSRSAIIKANNGRYVPISKEINHNVFLAFSPPKRDKHAIFVINITCPLSEYDITLDPKKTLVEFCNWDCLLSCFEALLRKFIEKEAGMETDTGINLERDRPIEVKTVVDEINQLSREEALGLNVMRPSDESISTRDLSRAIHGLPVSRHQVDLSASPSLGCFPSTASSDFTSITDMRKNIGIRSSSLCSAFTEQPFPRDLCNDSLSCKDRKSTRVTDPFQTETEVSSAHVSSNESHCKFKLPQPHKALPQKKETGFIANPICFKEEGFRKVPDLLPGRKNDKIQKCTMISSPVDALASIKEIRRKKLLNNLSKFSFKIPFEKPLLDKTELLTVGANNMNSETTINHHKVPNVNGNNAEKSLGCKLKESVAVQTTPLEVKYLTREPSIERIETMQVERYREEDNYSICANASISGASKLNLGENRNFQDNGIDGSAVRIIEEDVNQTIDSTSNVALSGITTKGSCIQNISQEKLTVPIRECKKFLSVEDMVLTAHDLRPSHCSAEETFDIPQCSVKSSMKSRKDILVSPRISISAFEAPSLGKESLLVLKRDDESNFNSVSQEPNFYDFREMPQEICSTNGFDRNYEDKKCIIGETPLRIVQQQAPRTKIVDYDSSPSSSQEISDSSESLVEIYSVVQNNKLKRKHDDDSNDIVSKAFFSSESYSPRGDSIQLIKETNLIFSPDLVPTQDKSNVKMDMKKFVTNHEIISSHSEPSTQEKPQDPTPSSNNDPVIKNTEVVNNTAIVVSSPYPSFGSQENSDELDPEWVEELDHSGKQFYIHRKSGITTYDQPKMKQESGAFKFNERYLFLPKGMSPILQEKFTNLTEESPTISSQRKKLVQFNVSDCSVDDLTAVKWTNEKTDKKTDFWPLLDQLLTESDKFSSKLTLESQVSNACTEELSQSDIKVYNVMFPYCFTKDIFKKLRVLGQLDNKFIVTVTAVDNSKEVIVLFDQHAVHERIRVENLTEEYKQHDGCAVWKSAPVDPPLPLALSSIEVRILESYMDKMNSLGFFYSVTDSNTIKVKRVPTCLLLRENREVTNRGVSVLRQHLESLIREQVDSLLNTRGVGTDHPTIIQNVISSEACRGAVKFGHPLTVPDCQAFLRNLSSCSLPFQCAHGRPALVPIVDLSQLKQKSRLSKPNLQKLKRQ